jgi:hypothetical protein
MYLYQYFDKYTTNLYDLTIAQIEYIRHMLRQIDFSLIINENTTVEMLRNYVKTLPQLYISNENMIQEHNQKLAEAIENYIKDFLSLKEEEARKYENVMVLKPWSAYIRKQLKTIIIVGTLMTTCYYYLSVLETYIHLSTLKNIQILKALLAEDLAYKGITGSRLADKIIFMHKIKPSDFFTYMKGVAKFWSIQAIKIKDIFINLITP